MTSTEPIITCSCTAPIERSMYFALSSSSVSLHARHFAVDPLDLPADRCAICTVLVPDCFVTCIRTPGLPLIRSTDRMSSVESFTSAMSFR